MKKTLTLDRLPLTRCSQFTVSRLRKTENQKRPEGFTIVELLVATTVFSVILLGALAGFLEIGRLFYKGVSTTNTQDVANQILQDISGQFQSASSFTKGLPQGVTGEVLPSSACTATDNSCYAYYCIGNTRYTYNITSNGSRTVSFSNPSIHSPGGNFGILKDVLPGTSGCARPCSDTGGPACDPTKGEIQLNKPQELLGDNMRLNAFYINGSPNSNLFSVRIVVAYGLDDAFVENPPIAVPLHCSGTSGIDQYCSVAELNTAVLRGWSQ